MADKKKTLKAKANINLKYDDEVTKIGEEISVREDDAKFMVEQGYITLLEELPKKDEKSKDDK